MHFYELLYLGQMLCLIPNHFALGYGSNGIAFCIIAVEIIREGISGKKNKNADLFRFNR